MLTFKYRIYLTPRQTTFLKTQLKNHCGLYNKALEERLNVYKNEKKSLSCYDQIKSLILTLDRKGGNYSSYQQTIRRLDKAYQSFFRRIKSKDKPGFPKFKKRFSSVEFGSYGDGWKVKDNLYVQGLGNVKVNWHRALFGKPKRLVIYVKGPKTYVSITTDATITHPSNNQAIGVDFGIRTFLTFSTGEKINHPLPLKRYLKRLKRLQRQKSKSVKGSLKHRKKSRAIAKTWFKIDNQRHNFLHKLSRRLVNENNLIVVEDLEIRKLNSLRNPTAKRNTNRKLNDLSFAEFVRMLEYKSEQSGNVLKKVNPAYTSQTCSSCGNLVEKGINERIHKCPCGLCLDRDINAAKNILNAGSLNQVSQRLKDCRTIQFGNESCLATAEQFFA